MRSQSQDGSHLPVSQTGAGSVVHPPSQGLQGLANPSTQQQIAQACIFSCVSESKQQLLAKGC